MENLIENEVLYEIKPKFNLIYEIGMPTGRKIKSTFIFFIILVIVSIVLTVTGIGLDVVKIELVPGVNIMGVLKIICYVASVLLFLKLAFHIIFQTLQYSHITYSFYKDHMVYEDDFLNQHRKTIQFTNIKEVEIRRTIWDRILGFGIIIIYTNAENEFSNGLIIYSIRDAKSHYAKIEEIINESRKNRQPEIAVNANVSSISETQNEESFKDSLKDINN